jgi:hypothetical protein
MNAESKVTPQHLQRGAYLYIRQSTLRQVLENTESTQRQYAIGCRAVALGWPEVGLVYDESQRVCLDPDQQVQQSLRHFFATFHRTGSAWATVQTFRRESVKFPKRGQAGSGAITWQELPLPEHPVNDERLCLLISHKVHHAKGHGLPRLAGGIFLLFDGGADEERHDFGFDLIYVVRRRYAVFYPVRNDVMAKPDGTLPTQRFDFATIRQRVAEGDDVRRTTEVLLEADDAPKCHLGELVDGGVAILHFFPRNGGKAEFCQLANSINLLANSGGRHLLVVPDDHGLTPKVEGKHGSRITLAGLVNDHDIEPGFPRVK